MKLVGGNRYWISKNGVPQKYSYLSEDISCEVLIIGGGITGTICAWYFNDAGIDTVLVDKNIVGFGSTSVSTSILQYEIDTDLTGLSGMLGMEAAAESFRLCEKSVDEIEGIVGKIGNNCGFLRQHCLYYTSKQSDIEYFKKEYKTRKEKGFQVDFFEEQEAKDKFSFPIKAGIYSTSGAGELDPYAFTHEVLSFCSGDKGNLRVFENTEVVHIANNSGDITAITKNGFKIAAKKIIIATGFEARKHIPQKTAKLTRSFTIVTKPVKNFEGWYEKCIIRDNAKNYTYLRTTPDNRIIIGGEDMEIGGMDSHMSNLEDSSSICQEKYSILEKRLEKMFPEVGNVSVEYKFNGIFGNTKDGLPYFGEYEGMPNTYFCMGYGSNGILYAIIGAQLLRELYGGRIPSYEYLFSFKR